MDFSGRPMFQRSSYFDHPWGPRSRAYYPQEQMYDPWIRQPQRQVFIDSEDFYDPLFGGRKKTEARCNCRDCRSQEESQRRIPRQNASKRRQRCTLDEDISSSNQEAASKESFQNGSDDKSFQKYDVISQTEPDPEDVQQRLKKIEIQSESETTGEREKEDSIKSESESGLVNDDDESELNENTDSSTEEDNEAISKEQDLVQLKLKTINQIQIEVEELFQKISQISTESKQYDYLYCEEMLTKCLLKLDDILANGEDTIRTARKRLVKEINKALSSLEEKRQVNAST